MSARTDRLVSLSEDGAFIATTQPVPPGTPMFLELTLPDDEGRAEIDAVAVAGNGHDELGFHVRFLAVDEKTRAFIERTLAGARRAATPAPAPPAAPFGKLPPTSPGGEPIADVIAPAAAPKPAPAPAALEPEITAPFARVEPAPPPPRTDTQPLVATALSLDETQPFVPAGSAAPLAAAEAALDAAFASTSAPATDEDEDAIDVAMDDAPVSKNPFGTQSTPPVTNPFAAGDTSQKRILVDGDDDATRKWSREELARPAVPALPITTVVGKLADAPAAPPPPRSSTPVPKAPLPKIASLEVPGGTPLPSVEETQRWPTAKVRVSNAPLEMPVGDVPFSPPDVDDDAPTEAGGLDALFPEAADARYPEPPLPKGLEAPPELSFDPAPALAPAAVVEEPAVLKPAIDDGPPTPPHAEELFGAAGGMLGDDDEVIAGGPGFGFGVEVTDPGSGVNPHAATMEDVPLGSFDDDDHGQATEPLPTDEDGAEPLEMVEVEEIDDLKDVVGAPPPSTNAASTSPGLQSPVAAAIVSPPPPLTTLTSPTMPPLTPPPPLTTSPMSPVSTRFPTPAVAAGGWAAEIGSTPRASVAPLRDDPLGTPSPAGKAPPPPLPGPAVTSQATLPPSAGAPPLPKPPTPLPARAPTPKPSETPSPFAALAAAAVSAPDTPFAPSPTTAATLGADDAAPPASELTSPWSLSDLQGKPPPPTDKTTPWPTSSFQTAPKAEPPPVSSTTKWPATPKADTPPVSSTTKWPAASFKTEPAAPDTSPWPTSNPFATPSGDTQNPFAPSADPVGGAPSSSGNPFAPASGSGPQPSPAPPSSSSAPGLPPAPPSSSSSSALPPAPSSSSPAPSSPSSSFAPGLPPAPSSSSSPPLPAPPPAMTGSKPQPTEPYLTLKGLKDLAPLPAPPQPLAPAVRQSTDPFVPTWSTPPPEPGLDAPPALSSSSSAMDLPLSAMTPLPPAAIAGSLLDNNAMPSIPPEAAAAVETFFDDMAFSAAEPSAQSEPALWSVSADTARPPPGAGPEEDDLPVVVGSAPSPTPAQPLPGWIVGEPGKK